MAEEAALGFLLDTLKEVLKERSDLIAGAKTELGKLKNEFELLKRFLKESSRISNKGDVFEEIERQVREVVYEAEDMLETCMIEAAAKGKMSTLITKLFTKDVSLAQQVRSLRKDKVTDMYDKAKKELDAMKNRPGSSASGAQQPQPRLEQEEIRRDKLVGFKDAETTITGFLTETTAELDVISIVGMAGLGKTTLARKIYDSWANLCTRVWITVSGKFNKRQVFLDILSEFTSTDNNKMSDDKLGDAVRSCLKKSRYLIIFDDVWNLKDMEEIKNFLPTANSMGKVIITTREEDVGKIASTRKPHKLRFLKPDESWELLQLEVFGDLQSCPGDLASIGEQIADKCDGLPLAISMIGGILRAQTTVEQVTGVTQNEWDKVFENMPQYLRRGRVSEVIDLSYKRLPDELRESFLYLGIFPEDHVIPSWELMRLWIAEGFVQKKEEHNSVEETAEWYLRQLVNRSLLMVSKTNSMGQVKMCRVHDAVRAFCISKAAELNVFKEIIIMDRERPDAAGTEDIITTDQMHRRICLHSSDPSMFLSAAKGRRKIRSFLSFHKTTAALEKDYLDAFDLLRVLCSNSIRFSQLPDKTKKLMHLRYITLDVDDLKNLPKDLSHLWFLQTLVVQTRPENIIKVQANIWSMTRLRHLKTNAAILLDDVVLTSNRSTASLQTLSNLSTKSCTGSISNNARDVRSLGIRGDIATLWETNKFLNSFHHLEKLKLVNKSSAKLQRLPEPDCFPPNLKRLTLSSTHLNWIEMSQLAKLKTLEVLKLKDNAFAGTTWTVEAHHVFPRLQFLLIADAGLYSWEASTQNFPKLNCLSLNKCEKLKEIPPQLLEKLQKLDMHRVRQSVYEPAKIIFAHHLEKQLHQGHQSGGSRWTTGLHLTYGDIIKY